MAGDPDDTPGDGQDGAGDEPADEGRPARAPREGGSGRTVNFDGGDGAGYLLGLLLWAGVVLPFLGSGPAGVKAWWMAKFLNKAPDGSELP